MPTDHQLSDVLSEFARTMVTDFAIQDILDRLVARIVEILPITAAGVTLISPGAHPLDAAASNASAMAYEQLQTDLGEGPCIDAYLRGEAVAVPDLRDEHRFPAFRPRALAAGLAAVFSFPLRDGEDRLGALDLYRGTPGPIDASTMAAAQTLADVTAAYLLNARIRADLQASFDRYRKMSMHDALTGLPNRVLLLERLEHALQRRLRSGGMVAVLFADLDQFKLVNDIYGHRCGDELLVAVGRRLTERLRPGDTLARWSGDEFVIVCEDLATRSDAERIALRVNAALTEPIEMAAGEVALTAAIGIALTGRADLTPEELLEGADGAMYEAKRRGGGRHQIVELGGLRLVDQPPKAVRHEQGW